MKNILELLKVIFFISVPALLAYLSSNNSILDQWKTQKYLGDNFNIELFKQYLLIIGTIITSGYLSISNALNIRKNSVLLSQRAALINEWKISTLYYLESIIIDEHTSSIKFKIWRERRGIIYRISKKFYNAIGKNRKIVFYERQIEGLTDMDNTSMYYEVAPNIQGVVGLCYNEKEIQYEEDFSLSLDAHHLNPFQLSRARQIKFCLCSPIFNTNNEIVTIISFESIHCININTNFENQLANAITNFCQTLYQNCPELFK
ncbi:hypothetical protein UF75_2253 [Desulfosporosinus sp. I2]|uniref:hypothetical protein n=1 Tax=Desulfosporosinus sp. I2 TaxID=1617025 RepID=UPI0005ED5679|nr:hypothetical protein [Desulfosporosinus sp. I2]KJR47340.1 hypothetical protein UF75_2253 [Desulfosporosinus sp. I2]